MLKRKILIFLLFTGALTANAQASKICTFNIRFENPNDGIHQWENRKESVINFIKVEDIDVVGMQEVLQSQIQYLETNLPHYQRIGVGRDDGHAKGEYSPIFYKKSKYQLLDSGTFWLSTDRTKPNKGWDAALPRICTWALLYEQQNKDTTLILNTHFDHVGVRARINSVDVILAVMKEMNHSGKTVLMGDFNLEPNSEPILKILNSGFTDSFSVPLKLGPAGTYNAFKVGKKYPRRIDYIFLKNAQAVTYKVNSMLINETFLSDHFPVVVELKSFR